MAVALQEKEKALIIDLDIGMGNIDVLIGAASSRTIIDVMENRHALAQSLSSGPKFGTYPEERGLRRSIKLTERSGRLL